MSYLYGGDKCGFSVRVVNIFDITSGVTLILLLLSVLLCILLIISCDFKICEENNYFMLLFVMFSILCVIAILANTLFSFISIVKIVYSDYKAHTANCSSPAFYSAFTYVTIEFITLAAIIFIAIGLIIYCCYKFF